MIRILYILFYILYVNTINAYPIGIGPNKFYDSNFNKNKICYLNYNNAYSSFYNWKKNSDENHHKKILDDTLWLNKNRFISSTLLVGIYNSDDINNILNYICLLRKTSHNSYKILNIFSNPINNLCDDEELFNNLICFCNENDATIDFENLKKINNSKYYYTYIFKYLF
jgi:hypothetical protein